MQFDWDPQKNDWLHQQRGIRFETIVAAIRAGGLLDILAHHNPTRYPNHRLLVVQIDDYAYVVPCIVEGERYVLKTVYASRKATRDYVTQEDE
jgi:uncharacterized DUF497 family protein